MNPVREATKIVNEVLKLVGEELIAEPIEGTISQRLEAILDLYADKLIAMNPQYKKFINKRDIPEMVVIYLNNAINKQRCKEE
jgi:methionine aminopeptidase